MSETDYEFDDLPFASVPTGTTLLLTASDRAGSRLARRLVLAGDDRGEGMVFVSTTTGGGALVERCQTAARGLDTTRLGVIDASGTEDTETDTDAQVGSVSSTGDLTGISIEFSIVYSKLYEDDVTRIRTCFDSISTLFMYVDFRTVVRFVHTIAGRISKTRGFGVFVLDPAMHEPQVVRTLAQLCDGRLDLRATDSGEYELELELHGVGDGPRGWQPIGFQ